MTSLEKYLENPNKCLHCGKPILPQEGQRLSDVKKKKFCSHSCSASYNNSKRSNTKDESNYCPICGKPKTKKAEICSDCYNQSRSISNKTLGYYINNNKYLTTKCSDIRTNARKVLENSNRIKLCSCCKDERFNSILEVHHIKGILEFSKDTLISEINSLDNLVYLCPNCHALLEKGLISLE